MKLFQIQGHRGARGSYPDNTLMALEYALDLGVDAIEVDICFTKDKVPILHHDLYVNPDYLYFNSERKVGVSIPIIEMNISEIKQIDCGRSPNPKFPAQNLGAQKIPTLEEVFQLFIKKSSKTLLNLELKYAPQLSPSPQEYCFELSKYLVKYRDLLPQIMLHSFSVPLLTARQGVEIFGKIPTGLLIEESLDLQYCVDQKRQLNLDFITPEADLLNSIKQVNKLKEAGYKVFVWTVNKKREWERLEKLKVDGMITDFPEHLIQWRNHLSTK